MKRFQIHKTDIYVTGTSRRPMGQTSAMCITYVSATNSVPLPSFWPSTSTAVSRCSCRTPSVGGITFFRKTIVLESARLGFRKRLVSFLEPQSPRKNFGYFSLNNSSTALVYIIPIAQISAKFINNFRLLKKHFEHRVNADK